MYENLKKSDAVWSRYRVKSRNRRFPNRTSAKLNPPNVKREEVEK
jgi:hypothetical protein